MDRFALKCEDSPDPFRVEGKGNGGRLIYSLCFLFTVEQFAPPLSQLCKVFVLCQPRASRTSCCGRGAVLAHSQVSLLSPERRSHAREGATRHEKMPNERLPLPREATNPGTGQAFFFSTLTAPSCSRTIGPSWCWRSGSELAFKVPEVLSHCTPLPGALAWCRRSWYFTFRFFFKKNHFFFFCAPPTHRCKLVLLSLFFSIACEEGEVQDLSRFSPCSGTKSYRTGLAPSERRQRYVGATSTLSWTLALFNVGTSCFQRSRDERALVVHTTSKSLGGAVFAE